MSNTSPFHVETLFDQNTFTFTHIVVDAETKKAAIIDSVLDYDQFSGRTNTTSADKVVEYVTHQQLSVEYILETHVHADHITAAHYLQGKLGGKIAMGSGIKDVLAMWVPLFDITDDTPMDGSQFDVLFDDGDTFTVGNLNFTVWHTPGHTPACASYLVGDAIFVGDTMFAPHLGTARCDFPGGSAKQLFETVQRFYTLDDDTRVFLAHDYPQEGKEPLVCTTIKEAKASNIQIRPETSVDEYVNKREARDATLNVPKLLLPSLQANLRNGQFGNAASNGTQFVKIPVNAI